MILVIADPLNAALPVCDENLEVRSVVNVPQPTIRVAGDSTIDWQIAVPTVAAFDELHAAYQWETPRSPGIAPEPGGASLLTALLHRARGASGGTVIGPAIPAQGLIDPNDPTWPRTFGLWRPFPAERGRPQLAWRLDRFLGIRPAADAQIECPDAASSQRAECVVLDDAGLGFRSSVERWPAELTSLDQPPTRILLKTAGVLDASPLWSHLIDAHRQRLTTYVAVGDLRKGYAAIGQPHSWQRTAEEVAAAVRDHPLLGRSQRVVVSLGMAGAVMIERDGDTTLVFDSMHQEGDWENQRPGSATGLGTCIMAALALAVTRDLNAPAWTDALARGLIAARGVHEAGYELSDDHGSVRFPITRAVTALRDDAETTTVLSRVIIPAGHDWPAATDGCGGLQALAHRIVFEGNAAAGRGLPVERLGAWVSVDRTEIESVRSVRLIVDQYLNQRHRQRPLNLAVFGPPGSGKSFAVKQIAKEWAEGGTRVSVLEFNVAQFTSTADLPVSLQRVRDAAVEQTLPLVFWDEFDTPFDGRELGWLARFLAPMQDGVFLEGGVARPIGPAIFVFAGGTHPTLASFKDRAISVPGTKATDFLSRLRGHIDILGPNPRDEADRAFVLRRALLLRAQLLGRAPHLAPNGRPNLDPGVLRAFLEVPEYLHGARSMEAIIEMSGLAGRLRFERSALPAPHQLALHVDAPAFLALIHHGSARPEPESDDVRSG